jgi:hypothetical protein
MGDMGAGQGMLVVETIAKIRRAFFSQRKAIKAICREFRVSRKVVRKVIRHARLKWTFAGFGIVATGQTLDENQVSPSA